MLIYNLISYNIVCNTNTATNANEIKALACVESEKKGWWHSPVFLGQDEGLWRFQKKQNDCLQDPSPRLIQYSCVVVQQGLVSYKILHWWLVRLYMLRWISQSQVTLLSWWTISQLCSPREVVWRESVFVNLTQTCQKGKNWLWEMLEAVKTCNGAWRKGFCDRLSSTWMDGRGNQNPVTTGMAQQHVST